MATFNGDILVNYVLFLNGSQDGYAEFTLQSAQLSASPDGYGQVKTAPSKSFGSQDGYGQHRLVALPASSINPIPHYELTCQDNTGNRHYWTDTSISLTNAPILGGGLTYLSSTLTVLGIF